MRSSGDGVAVMKFFNKMTERSLNVLFVWLERQHVDRRGGRDSNTKCANKVE